MLESKVGNVDYSSYQSSKKQEEEELVFPSNEPSTIQATLDKWSLYYPKEYHGNEDEWRNEIKRKIEKDNKTQITYMSGMVEIYFPNDVKKVVYPDGY